MPSVFPKLNLKDQSQIVVLNSPASFEPELKSLKGVDVVRDLKKAKALTFSIAFVTKHSEVEAVARSIGKKAAGDAIVWFAYPKKTSKKYQSEISRDSGGWDALGKEGFEPVRLIAIDEDWSAVRFRRATFIKTMTRPHEYRLTTKKNK
jgi:hypothetical protein